MEIWDILGGGDISKWKRNPNRKICCMNGSWENIKYDPNINLYLARDIDAILRYPETIKKIKNQKKIEYILKNKVRESIPNNKDFGAIRAVGILAIYQLIINKNIKNIHIFGMDGYKKSEMEYKRIGQNIKSSRDKWGKFKQSTNENIIWHIEKIINNYPETNIIWHISNIDDECPVPTKLMKLNLRRLTFEV